MPGNEKFYIGELSRRSGLSRDTIRYYEALDVLPEAPRSESGYRLYGADDVERLKFVGQAQRLGLTLEEIAEILDVVDAGEEPCGQVRQRLEARLRETRARIEELRDLERRLSATLSRTDVPRSGADQRCRIIESSVGPGGCA